ncbi:[NiFe]-hydrogenase assembly chaperone HybE [Oricola thermophila]|uniref:[NiFe]-hydrogenase assembly chaperone HybE n=1 Tax=Oricola thermophila TaxID=2742145 RepID=A0A6N1VE44_9HYPH|nr:[NiFe]-hydrogenase assembly chaperone HybE [Oricola thermophila]QKV17317.1 [NiFe]-hydrogenase assembly chaperone HybE [Oricola thermophila]
MTDAADIAETLEACFEEIRTSRMAGVPILNEALSVKAVGGCRWNGYWLCVLVTPWFMNLMLVPDEAGGESAVPGAKRNFVFPAGSFEFILGSEDGIGSYWMCSLFSPVLEFSDQETAEAAAAAALEALFEGGGETDASEEAMARMWRGEIPAPAEPDAELAEDEADCGKPVAGTDVSRRQFLSGGRREARHEP